MSKQHLIVDCEIIGDKKPVFLIGCKIKETGKRMAFWHHRKGDMEKFEKLLLSGKYTVLTFNGENFDRPLIAAALMGYGPEALKQLANEIITEQIRSWQTYKLYELDFIEYDHIDLIDVAPGVMISLKTYAGRMSHPSMMDMPVAHDVDPTAKQIQIIEDYCLHDLDVTEALLDTLSEEMSLRYRLSAEYGIDLRSKSDAQIAEAILKKKVGISNGEKHIPHFVNYQTPNFIQSKNPVIKELIDLCNQHEFKIDRRNGSPEAPEFLKDPVHIGKGTYQMGIGGLHSTHDTKMHLEASDKLMLSDFDVASYYPNIMMKAGLVPKLGGNKGEKFIEEYRKIYEQRIAAKRAGDKVVANSLKITLNGTFGKLGNLYCSFYSPDLLLAVTITGQLNLLCLIDELEKIKGVEVRSANTDGVLVAYPPATRERVLKVFAANAKRTGFEYEETPYKTYAAKDVNNYIAIKQDGKAKRKGLYAIAGVQEMKNPTMEVCSNMAVDYLTSGILPEEAIKKYTDIRDFVSIRNVKGGCIQHTKYIEVDDWVNTAPGEWRRPCWSAMKASEKRKSRPKPIQVGVGGTPLGRVARWYMTKDILPPITSMSNEIEGLSNGSQVAKTEGSRACMTLPKKLPKDLNYQWYINETYSILNDLGVEISNRL